MAAEQQKIKQIGSLITLINKVLAGVFVVSFAWALVQAVLSTWSFGVPGFAATILIVLCLAVFAVFKKNLILKILELCSNPAILIPISLFASLALLVVSQNLSTSIIDGTWDFPLLGRDAYDIAFTGSLADGRDVYYARYPNNQLLLLLVSGLFRFIAWANPEVSITDCHCIAIFVNTLILVFATMILALTLKKEHGAKAATALVLFSICFIPFWCYSSIYYSDVIPMLFIAFELAIFTKLYKATGHKMLTLWVLLGLISGIAFEVKATTIFVFMGIVLFEAIALLKSDHAQKLKQAKDISLSFIVFGLTIAMVGATIQGTLKISDEDYEKYQFPYTHWVMMSLNKTGGYNQEDVNFTNSFGNKEEKQEANIEAILARLSERGAIGTINHLLVVKVQRTWGTGWLGGDHYVSEYPDHEESLFYSLFSEKGDKHGAVKYFTQIIWLLLLLTLVFGGTKGFCKPPSPLPFAAMFALVLFFAFELVWECNSRYVVHMTPLILMIAAVSLTTPSGSKS